MIRARKFRFIILSKIIRPFHAYTVINFWSDSFFFKHINFSRGKIIAIDEIRNVIPLFRFFVYSFSIQRGNDTWKYENAAQFGSNEWTWTIRRGHDRPACLPCIEFFHDSRVYHLLIPPGCISRAGNARKCGTIEPGFYLIPESPDKSPRIQSNFSMFSSRY